jgi:hypothetical protein
MKCTKEPVCKNRDILLKFSDNAKKPLGVNISLNSCSYFDPEPDIDDNDDDSDDNSDDGKDE